VLETETLAGLEHPLLTVVSPRVLADRVATYDLLQQGGYTDMVVYLAQQIHQFRLLGKEFAMQHLGTEDEMKLTWRALLKSLTPEERLEDMSPEEILRGLHPRKAAWRDFLAKLPPEERLEGMSLEERLRGLKPEQAAWRDLLKRLPPEERLEGMSAEDLLRGLKPEELDRLRRLLPPSPPKDDSSRSS
jgi:hypothetical protein